VLEGDAVEEIWVSCDDPWSKVPLEAVDVAVLDDDAVD
jgi:hypothetical protein